MEATGLSNLASAVVQHHLCGTRSSRQSRGQETGTTSWWWEVEGFMGMFQNHRRHHGGKMGHGLWQVTPEGTARGKASEGFEFRVCTACGKSKLRFSVRI